MLTLTCIAIALGSGFLLGLPLLWLGRREKPLTESDWLLAPFLGLGAIVLILNNLIYADLTVSQCTPWIWASAGLLWLGLILKHGPGPLLACCPRRVLLAMVAVYLFHALGLLLTGAESYAGRAWGDQYNYTTVAQFLCDSPLSLSWEGLGQRPYLAEAVLVYKHDRIGAMLLQGFLACSAGTETRHLFEATILLGPALVVVGIYALACRLAFGRRWALLTAVIAGLLPALTIMHLDAFLAQVLAIPFLLCLLAIQHEFLTRPGLSTLMQTGILLAAITALYTEFVPILLVLLLLFCIGGLAVRCLQPARGAWTLAALVVLMFGLNPLYTPALVRIMGRLGNATGENNPMGFGWISSFGAVWLNDRGLDQHSAWSAFTVAVAVGLTAVAIAGLLRQTWLGVARDWATVRSDGGRGAWAVLSLAVVALALIPALMAPGVVRHQYQFIKLVLTVGPLLVVGLAALARGTGRAASSDPVRLGWWRNLGLYRAASWSLLGAVALLAVGGSFSLLIRTAYYRPGAHKYPSMLDPRRLEAMRMLEHLEAQPLVLACGPGLYENCWFAYAARHNPVWLVSPVLNNEIVVGFASGRSKDHRPLSVGGNLVDLKSVPEKALVLTQVQNDQVAVHGQSHLVWSNAQYQLWELGPGPCELEPLPAALRP